MKHFNRSNTTANTITVTRCKDDIVRFKVGYSRHIYEISIHALATSKLVKAWCINKGGWRVLNNNEIAAIAVQLIEAQS